MVGGVDGCRAGRVGVQRQTGGPLSVHLYRTTAELMNAAPEFDLLAIDIPIGLEKTGSRTAYSLARKLIGPRASSVFPAPVRATLECETYDEACSKSLEACGHQAFAILPRIREVDNAVRNSQTLKRRVREAHPEVSFYYLNGERPLTRSKKSGLGFRDRYRLIEAFFGPVIDELRAAVSERDVADDDLLDALAVLWSAERVIAGCSVGIPDRAERDCYGLPMHIVA
jgi:predicted RNase H-like nuclease